MSLAAHLPILPIAIPALAAALMLFGYFEIFILLALLAWSVAYQQRLVQALSVLLLELSELSPELSP